MKSKRAKATMLVLLLVGGAAAPLACAAVGSVHAQPRGMVQEQLQAEPSDVEPQVPHRAPAVVVGTEASRKAKTVEVGSKSPVLETAGPPSRDGNTWEVNGTEAKAPDGSSGVMDQLGGLLLGLLGDHLDVVVPVLLGALGAVFLRPEVRRRRVALAIQHAFYAVEDLKAECVRAGKPFPFLDKTTAALQAANDYCVAQGWRALAPWEVARAQRDWKALHGAEKAASARLGGMSLVSAGRGAGHHGG